MANLFSGMLLRELRKNKQLTIEQVSLGICDKSTLLRIERGETNPSYVVLEALLERMGLNPASYVFGIENKKESQFKNEIHEIDYLLSINKIDKAEEKYKLLEAKVNKNVKSYSAEKRLEKQTALRLKIGIMNKKATNPTKVLPITNKAISLSIPNFNITEIPSYLLTANEIFLINSLAGTYFKIGRKEKELEILFLLKESIEKYHQDMMEKTMGYTLTLFNLANALEESGKHQTSIDICNTAIEHCNQNNVFQFLPKLTYIKIYCMFKTGQPINEHYELIEASYHTLILYGDLKSAELIKNNVIKENIMKWRL